jgi:uncharacterized protein YndB with AHSA1/START domain
MRHHTITTTFATPSDEVFAYLADIEKLPEWATEFARDAGGSAAADSSL